MGISNIGVKPTARLLSGTAIPKHKAYEAVAKLVIQIIITIKMIIRIFTKKHIVIPMSSIEIDRPINNDRKQERYNEIHRKFRCDFC